MYFCNYTVAMKNNLVYSYQQLIGVLRRAVIFYRYR